MSYKVVNTHVVPGMDYGEKLLEPFDVTLVTGSWVTEDDLISNIAGADAIICSAPAQPWTSRVLQTLSSCRILSTNSIGYDRVDVEEFALLAQYWMDDCSDVDDCLVADWYVDGTRF